MTISNSVEIYDNGADKIIALVTGGIDEKVMHALCSNSFDVLILTKGDYSNLEMLLKIKESINDLQLRCSEIDWTSISKLSEIKNLDIGGWFDCPLDFSKLTKLENLNVYWNVGMEGRLLNIKSLKVLQIIGLDAPDLSVLGNMPTLDYLALIQCKKLTSLSGIGKFRELQNLELVSCNQLEEVSELEECKALEFIFLDKCKKVKRLPEVKSLRKLVCGGKFRSLGWIADLQNLEMLRFNCILEDGDLGFLYSMPNLRAVLFTNRKNYSVKLKDIQSYLIDKGYVQDKVNLSFPQIP